jgi:hypothetical protein
MFTQIPGMNVGVLTSSMTVQSRYIEPNSHLDSLLAQIKREKGKPDIVLANAGVVKASVITQTTKSFV